MKLSAAAEEVALFFAQMLDHEYTTKKVFRENFFKDWRKVHLFLGCDEAIGPEHHSWEKPWS